MYEPETGNFFWLVPGYGRELDKPIGYKTTTAYSNVTFHGIKIRKHVLAWFYMTGEFPPEDFSIDFKDGNPRNNSWDNLYLAPSLVLIARRVEKVKLKQNKVLNGTLVQQTKPVKKARFSSKSVIPAVEDFIKTKRLVDGHYISDADRVEDNAH